MKFAVDQGVAFMYHGKLRMGTVAEVKPTLIVLLCDQDERPSPSGYKNFSYAKMTELKELWRAPLVR